MEMRREETTWGGGPKCVWEFSLKCDLKSRPPGVRVWTEFECPNIRSRRRLF
jgi:hypothetical protein